MACHISQQPWKALSHQNTCSDSARPKEVWVKKTSNTECSLFLSSQTFPLQRNPKCVYKTRQHVSLTTLAFSIVIKSAERQIYMESKESVGDMKPNFRNGNHNIEASSFDINAIIWKTWRDFSVVKQNLKKEFNESIRGCPWNCMISIAWWGAVTAFVVIIKVF